MDNLTKEFKDALKYFDLNIIGSRVHPEVAAKLEAFHVMLSNAIKNYEKSNTEQNSTLSVEVFDGELCPLLDKQVGFGEKEWESLK